MYTMFNFKTCVVAIVATVALFGVHVSSQKDARVIGGSLVDKTFHQNNLKWVTALDTRVKGEAGTFACGGEKWSNAMRRVQIGACRLPPMTHPCTHARTHARTRVVPLYYRSPVHGRRGVHGI